MTLTSTTKTKTNKTTTDAASRKRKADAAAPGSSEAKKPRVSLDTFFSPVVSSTVKKEANGKRDVSLSTEQIRVLRMVVEEEKNVFFTGSAGTGKSLLLRAIINALQKKYAKSKGAVSITASTGMAASNIGGMTIHSWGAVSPLVTDVGKQVACIKTCKPAFQRWKNTKVLIIDEVSMVDGNLFTMIASLAAELRKKTERPFGGIQLVVTGDFFQLPPVTKGKQEPFFAFESTAWKTCIEHTVNLTQVFRQKDNTFVDMLNAMRTGIFPDSAGDVIRSLARELPPHPSELLPTALYPLRQEVEHANAKHLGALPGPSRFFDARDSGKAEGPRREKLLDDLMAVARLELRPGAQVMLVKNVDALRGLVNGAVGRMLGFYTPSACGVRANGKTGAIPGIVIGEDGKPMGPGKENVKLESSSKVKSEDVKEKKPLKEEEYPLVEFSTPTGKEVILLLRDEFRVEDSRGNVLVRRMQIPLVLAWAMSIHKSQGQTIERVKVNLGHVFEKGQSYVALSRATSLDGLQVLGFQPAKVMAHKKVLDWSKTLETTGESTEH